MYADTSEAAGCLFCQIIAGQRSAEVVFESPSTIAFLDRFPAARGHTLVVPKQHAATLLDLDEGAAGALFGGLFEVVALLRDALRPVGFNVGWNHGAAAGQHVFHLHVHVLPRFEGGGSGVQAVGEGARGADVHQVAEAVKSSMGWPKDGRSITPIGLVGQRRRTPLASAGPRR